MSVKPAASPTNTNTFIFRLNENGSGPEVVQNAFLEKGWEEFDEERQQDHEWNLWWRTSRFRLSDYYDIQPWQQLNHFPRTTGITKKDMLARNMKRMRGVYGASIFNFTPLAFILPNDYTKFVAEYSRLRQSDNGTAKEYWICKPADLSRGRGIFLFKDLSELAYDCSAVVQKYLSNPLLISGYKFDLRVYVVVLSFHPLVIYIYDEGIVRFSTEKFDMSSINNQFSHLTNTSINKLSPSYTHDKERIGPGCKWSFATLRNYFHQQNIEYNVLWQRICNIVIYTMLAQTPSVPKVSNCFELFGFDILIDNTLKPWLLEVNFSPALGLDCSTDHIVKNALLSDIIDMLSFSNEDLERGRQTAITKQSYGGNHNSNVRKSDVLRKRPSVARSLSQANSKLSLSRSSTNTQLKCSNKNQDDEKVKSEISDTKPRTISVLYKKQNSIINPRVESKPVVNNPIYSQDNSQQQSSKQTASENLIRHHSSSNLADTKLSSSQLNHTESVTDDSKMGQTANMPDGNNENKKKQTTIKSPRQGKRSYGKLSSGYGQKYVTTPRISNSKSTSSLLRNRNKQQANTMLRPTSRDSALPNVCKAVFHLNTKKDLMDFKFDRTQRCKHILKPAAKVGDFNLIFPFNEATKRASWPNLDIRTVIRETQKQLRRTMCHGPVRQQCTVRGPARRASTFALSKPCKDHVIQQITNLHMTSTDPVPVNS